MTALASYLSAAVTAGLSTPGLAPECECPVEHTVSKLGHSRCCPWWKETLVPRSWEPVPGTIAVFVCGSDTHADGSPHDFGWATYVDDTMSTGVCRCGLWEQHHDLWRAP